MAYSEQDYPRNTKLRILTDFTGFSSSIYSLARALPILRIPYTDLIDRNSDQKCHIRKHHVFLYRNIISSNALDYGSDIERFTDYNDDVDDGSFHDHVEEEADDAFAGDDDKTGKSGK
ncbi:Hypothetical predicted protein [Octopus vulgaris]|uniref:Uncharacterized protein n=1 Tax=Octopus vulgaris TaxID=6645 RepID=A0AA36F612_OCTVU|nr:Hypothetical predicted protein [Octopus vulgaris]